MDFNSISLGDLITILTIGVSLGIVYMRVMNKIKGVSNAILGNKYYLEFKLGEQDIRISYIERILKKNNERLHIDTSDEDSELKQRLNEAVTHYKEKMALLKAMGGELIESPVKSGMKL